VLDLPGLDNPLNMVSTNFTYAQIVIESPGAEGFANVKGNAISNLLKRHRYSSPRPDAAAGFPSAPPRGSDASGHLRTRLSTGFVNGFPACL
jgi:hypothetical protein